MTKTTETANSGSETVTVQAEGKIIKLNMAPSADLPPASGGTVPPVVVRTYTPPAPPQKGMVAVHHKSNADIVHYNEACSMVGVKRCCVCGGFFYPDAIYENENCVACVDEWDIVEQFETPYYADASMLVALHAFQRPDGSGNVESMIDHHLMPYREHYAVQWDAHGNHWIKVGESETIFTCHTDTVGSLLTRSQLTLVNGKLSNKRGVLGSDDSAGVFVMLRMIDEGVPGLYVFHASEESGCRGSRAFVAEHQEMLKGYRRCVSFDRRGTSSVITCQSPGRCCSTEFALELCERLTTAVGLVPLSFKPDDGGSFTDSASYMSVVPECTNISVGYTGAHGASEQLDVAFLLSLADHACFVDWESLPTKRDPSVREPRYTPAPQYWSTAQPKQFKQRSFGHFAENSDWMWDEYDGFNDTGSVRSLSNATLSKLNTPSSELMLRRFHLDDALVVDDYFAAMSIEELMAMILTDPAAAASIINTMLDLGLPNVKGDSGDKLPHGLQ